MRILEKLRLLVKPKREWSKGLASEVVYLVETLKQEGKLRIIVDCGAGEGRHSVYTAKQGAKKVFAVEIDFEQIEIIKRKKKLFNLNNIVVVNKNVLEHLKSFLDSSVDGIIDSGMSHCLTRETDRQKFVELTYLKLQNGGLYSISHFSENEKLSQEHYKTDLKGLKALFPEKRWEEEIPWHEDTWQRKDKKRHYAYKAVLRKR